MILSLEWLSDYVPLPAADRLVERLLLSGLNHESTATVGADTAIEIEVTSNRPDCLGHIGVAREVAVLFGTRSWPCRRANGHSTTRICRD